MAADLLRQQQDEIENMEEREEFLIRLARAILRKAHEK